MTKTIKLTYDINILAGPSYGSIVLKDAATSGVVSSYKSVKNNILTIDPVANLGAGKTYVIYVPTGAVKDSDGNCSMSYTITFNT